MKKFLTEFKEFAVRGNVIDMAVGIVIGGAFSKIVTALVNMVMSVVGLFTSAVNLSELAVTLQRAGEEAPYFSLPYGAFLQSVLEFIILALCVFCALKVINRFKRKKAEEVVEAAAAAEPSKEETLLAPRPAESADRNRQMSLSVYNTRKSVRRLHLRTPFYCFVTKNTLAAAGRGRPAWSKK